MSERTVGGKYALEREIARGGMGAVWVAFDLRLRRRVALKLMRSDHTTYASLRGRFEREAMAIAQLQNPHVIQVYDYGIDDDSPYIVMELLEGEDLEARLLRQPRMSLGAVLPIAIQISKALAAAHSAGIIHRDLKPANIFLARSDTEEVVKILDFGVAAIVSALAGDDLRTTRAGSLLGTPSYMAPEQVRGARNVDQRADLWSLGVILYRMLTAELPFSGDALGDLIVKVCTDPVAPPSSIIPELGADVDAFFDRALSKDPAQRFQSARDMANAFAALSGTGSRPTVAKILVVDDEPDVALLIKQRFRQHIRKSIYEFVFATDGEGALDQLRRHPDIDVALTDINMPGMDGLTFLAHVGEVNPILKAIIVSAYSDMSNIRQAMNRGAFDFLVKPIDFKDLEITIEKTIKHVRELRKTIQSTEENTLLRMFVSNGIVERLLPTVRASGLMASETIEATIAFIDVHDFMSAADTPAETVIRTLNANFEIIVPEVTSRQGVVDKFIGHTVMAIFRGDDHARRALDCCLAIRAQIQTMAARAGGHSPYAHGVSIGVDSGEMVWGSVGSKAFLRLDCTVVGQVVQAAARLQAIAGKNQIVVGESLQQVVLDTFECEPIGFKELPGKSEPAFVYNVVRSLSAGSINREVETLVTPGESMEWPGESQDSLRAGARDRSPQ